MKLGFEQLTEPYPDPDYLWKQGVVTFSLDCELARRDWPGQRPGLYRFFNAEDAAIDHGAAPGLGHWDRLAGRRSAQAASAARQEPLSSSVRRAASTGRDE